MTTIDLINKQIGQNEAYIREIEQLIKRYEGMIGSLQEENQHLKRSKKILKGEKEWDTYYK